MIERLRPECIRCMVKRQLDNVPSDAAVEKQMEYMQKILRVVADAPKSLSAPVLVQEFNRLQKEYFGTDEDFTEIKYYFNELMMRKAGAIEKRISKSEEPLKLALQYAMTGNYIDFGALHSVEEAKLDELLNKVGATEEIVGTGTKTKTAIMELKEYENLCDDLKNTKQLVYLTDNCGEIVLDKVFIQEIKKKYPELEISVIVRGENVLNDATMTDAKQIGLDKLVKVIGNGNGIAGTWMDALSEEALRTMHEADVILSKGQGNYETLRMCGLNVYYLFMCKCDMFAKGFNVPRFTGVLVNDRDCV